MAFTAPSYEDRFVRSLAALVITYHVQHDLFAEANCILCNLNCLLEMVILNQM